MAGLAASNAPAQPPAHKDTSAVSAPVLLAARLTPTARTHNPASPANAPILANKPTVRQLPNVVSAITAPYAPAHKDFKATQKLSVAGLSVSVIMTAKQANNAATDNVSIHALNLMPVAPTPNVKRSTTQKNVPAPPDTSVIPTYNVSRTKICACPARVARTLSATTWWVPTSASARLDALGTRTAAACAAVR